jgi:hypothetical protein
MTYLVSFIFDKFVLGSSLGLRLPLTLDFLDEHVNSQNQGKEQEGQTSDHKNHANAHTSRSMRVWLK